MREQKERNKRKRKFLHNTQKFYNLNNIPNKKYYFLTL